MQTWRRWPFAVKLTLSMTAVIVLTVGAVTVLSIRREQESFQNEHQQQAKLILETLEETMANPLILLDVDMLQELIQEVGESEMNITARIYDPEGRLVADSETENNLVFGINLDPYGQRLIARDNTLYEWEENNLVAGQAVIIGNRPIGAISITLPTARLDEKQANARNAGLTVALVALIGGAFLSVILSQTMTRPLSELTEVTQQIAEGQLDRRAAVEAGDEVSKLAGAFNVMTDKLQGTIKDLAQTNDELQQANAKVQEASRLKSEFLATISHELRTPLNAILGYSGIMLMGISGTFDDKARITIEHIEASGRHLLSLINDVLDISKIEAGRMDIVSVPITVTTMVKKWRDRIVVLSEKKGLEFETLVDPAMPKQLLGDEDRLTQIAQNLLSNAVKFTETGRVTLEVEPDGDQHWLIRVIDTGIGIPPEAMEYIFDEFRQVDGSSTRMYGGTGLGLSIVRKLAQAMGGDVTVTSQLDHGSTFVVKLPLHPVEESVMT